MNKNVVKILIPLIAILVVAEGVVFISKLNTPKTEVVPVVGKPAVLQPISLTWGETNDVFVGSDGELPLFLTSDKDVFVDALDLYIEYDPSMVTVSEVTTNADFVEPSFKKVNPEKGMVVMNFLVSEATGFRLTAGTKIEIARLKVNYAKEGEVEFGLGEATLVVENATAKVLPFNSEKLVINISR